MDATYSARKLSHSSLETIQVGGHPEWVVLLLGAAVRLAIGAWNSFIHPTLSAGSDALEFHRVAVGVAQGEVAFQFIIGWLYAQALGFVYSLTGPHIFVACALSTVAWLLSGYVLLLIASRLELPPRATLFVAAAYAFLPSSAFITSVPLREAYQLLFTNVMALGLLDMFDRKRSRIGGLATFIVGATLAGFLHGVFLIAGTIAALLAASAILLEPKDQKPRVRALSIATLLALAVYSSFMFSTYSYGTTLRMTPKLEVAGPGGVSVLDFRTRTQTTAATYATSSTLNNEGSTDLLQVSTAVAQYLFEPMPWRELRLLDYAAVAENAFRAAMLTLALYGLFRLNGGQRAKLLAILGLYCCIEGLWAIGTANWGTALRHHVPSWGLLLICGSYHLINVENSESRSATMS